MKIQKEDKRRRQFEDSASRVEYSRVSGMEYGRTKTEASISSFDVGSSARSTKQKDFRRKNGRHGKRFRRYYYAYKRNESRKN